MKKLFAFTAGIAVVLASAGIPVSAEDAVPANVEEAVYTQILSSYGADADEDGIVTEAELASLQSLSLNLDSVTDLSWMTRLSSLTYLSLTGGTFTDLSVLKQIPKLRNLSMTSVPLTDIAFTKEIALETFRIYDMPQITRAQKIDAMRWGDVTVKKGYSAECGALPIGLLDYEYENYHELAFTIENTDIACFDYTSGDTEVGSTFNVIYGNVPGTTRYSITLSGEELFSGQIQVIDSAFENPPLHGEMTETPEMLYSYTYGNNYAVKIGENLYGFRNGEVYLAEEHVLAHATVSYKDENGDYQYQDIVLLTDGTLKIGGTPVDTQGMKFTSLKSGRLTTAEGGLYGFQWDGKTLKPELIAEDFKEHLEYDSSFYYLNQNDEVVCYKWKTQDDGTKTYTCYPTGILKPTSAKNDYFVDENHVLWKYDRTNLKTVKVSEGVSWVGYHYYNSNTYGCVHIMDDGTAYRAGSTQQVTLTERDVQESYLENGRVTFGNYYTDDAEMNRIQNYHITYDHTMYMHCEGKDFAISNVSAFIGGEHIDATDALYVYFLRTDGSFWRYCWQTGSAEELTVQTMQNEPVPGDANGDGEFNTADVVAFQKWLLHDGTSLADWKAVDFNQDNLLNIYDFCLMKRLLLQNS